MGFEFFLASPSLAACATLRETFRLPVAAPPPEALHDPICLLLVYGLAARAYETVAVALGAPQSAQFALTRSAELVRKANLLARATIDHRPRRCYGRKR